MPGSEPGAKAGDRAWRRAEPGGEPSLVASPERKPGTGRGDEPCLVVFARAPVAGQVKTRLCSPVAAGPEAPAALTAEQAAAVHTAFVSDVCQTGARSGIRRRRLYVAGDVAHPQLVRIASNHGFEIRAQAGADLGARMAAAIADELTAGASAVVLVGTDSPTLPCAYLQSAAAWLGGDAEVVLGPAADGGYYLVGARRPISQLFAAGISWGTAQVLPATLLRLRELAAAGTRVALLPFFYDVDTPQDLWLLACHLRLATMTQRLAAAKDLQAAQQSQAAPPSKGTSRAADLVAEAPLADAELAAGGTVAVELVAGGTVAADLAAGGTVAADLAAGSRLAVELAAGGTVAVELAAGSTAAADLVAMDALTRLHAPATCAVLATLGWLTPAAGAVGDSRDA